MSLVITVVCLYFFCCFLWRLLASFEGPKKKERKKISVRLAVAIPAHNEGLTIAATVRSIITAGMRAEDVFVLPNGCGEDDRTAEEARACGASVPFIPVRGKEETLNYAIHTLRLFERYTHVCFFDADTVVDRNYFRVTRERLQKDPDADAICGRPKSLRYVPSVGDRFWERMAGAMLTAHRAVQYWQFHAVHKATQGKIGSILVVPGCAGTYSIEVLREIRWSGDTRIGDMDMTIECAKRKKKIVFEPGAIVYTQDPATFTDYTTQLYKRWYRGLWMNMGKHGILWKGPFSLLHWDCRLMFVDQFNLVLVPILFWIWAMTRTTPPKYPLASSLAVFWGVVLLESCICAYLEKRPDIFKYVWAFPVLRVFDTMMFLAATPSILVKREKNGEWTSPKRYVG